MAALRGFYDRVLRPLGRWLGNTRGLPLLLIGFGLIDVAIWTYADISGRWAAEMADGVNGMGPSDTYRTVVEDCLYALVMRTILRATICIGPGFLIWTFQRKRHEDGLVLPALAASIFAAVAVLVPTIHHNLPEAMAGAAGDEPYVGSFVFGIVLAGSAFGLLPLGTWLYERGTLLDRYVARAFLTPFLLCFSAFFSIWLISDMANNGSDYAAAKMSGGDIVLLYLAQMPSIIVLVLPIALLLSLLYALGRMSRCNELVSMMMAGKPVVRILMPLFLIGAMATYLCLACNFQFAPTSVGTVKAMLSGSNRGGKQRYAAFDQAYMNRTGRRIWFVGLYPREFSRKTRMESLAVLQFDQNWRLLKAVHANSAFWHREDSTWIFFNALTTDMDEHGAPIRATLYPEKYIVQGWNETPWKLVSAGLNPEYMGIPQLGAYLRAYQDLSKEKKAPFRTHWHYRLALPFSCLAAVLFGAPLGIVYSRRGLVGSVTAAVGLFFGLLFVTNFSVALGQGARIAPWLGAWLPPVLFSGIGFWLLDLRARNREVASPRARIAAWWRRRRARTA